MKIWIAYGIGGIFLGIFLARLAFPELCCKKHSFPYGWKTLLCQSGMLGAAALLACLQIPF